MKVHVEIAEIGHLTKYDAFRVNRDQVMDLEILRQRPPKPYKTFKLKYSGTFITTVKSRRAPTI